MSLDLVSIVEFSNENSHFFKEINQEWIQEMFALESKDQKVLENPEKYILHPGGQILFVKVEGLGIVGAGALMPTGPHEMELTKMGVFKKARGTGAGGFLLQALIQRALDLGVENLYLLTNKKCEAAIHLYEKHGFVHNKEIMQRFGGEYSRCDVAMRYHATFVERISQ
ncbi:GNAT family N-acetyltransferase [bacterium]|nr:GNAT family N-acetyltransferase [bacterium]